MHGQVSALSQKTDYRPDIDGLRAVAVLSVLAYHYGAPFPGWLHLSGGFTGVDVFFVISGFLVTSKLADEIRAGAFSVLGFYDRRMRRILPALLAMLAVTLLAGKFLLMPGDYMALAKSTAATAFGFSNFYFLSNTGYFDQSADLTPLLHTWSLAVEEQFYFVWPLLLFVLAAGRKRIDIAAVLGIITIAGFAASLFWFDADPKYAFFMALPRAWELAIGALLVFLPPLPRAIGEAAAAIGLILIAAGFVLVYAESFPGPAALYPCLGSALVIWPRRTETGLGHWLGFLSPIGLISYSLYLWHWPVWVLFRIYISNGTPQIREALALAAVSIVLAVLSYFLVEQPLRKRRLQPAQSVWAGLGACMLIYCASMYVDSADGLPGRIPGDVYAMRSLDAMWEWRCPAPFSRQPEDCNIGHPWQSTDRRFVLWGDSHASHFAPLFDTAAKRVGWSGALLTWCPAVLDDKLTAPKNDEPAYVAHCIEQRRTALAAIEGDPKIQIVFIATAWTNLVRYSINAGPAMQDRLQAFRAALDRLLSDLAPLHRHVIIVGDVPQWDHDLLPCALAARTPLLRRSCESSRDGMPAILPHQDVVLDLIATESAKYPDVSFFNPKRIMCPQGNCIEALDGEFLYRDPTHIRRNLSSRTMDDLVHLLKLDELFGRRS